MELLSATARSAVCVVRTLIGLLVVITTSTAAEPLHERFETWEPTWKVEVSGKIPAKVHRERMESAGREGRGELVRIDSSEAGIDARLTHQLPTARVLDELTASIWVRSEYAGWSLSLEVVASGVLDPRTDRPLRFTVPGEEYRDSGRWTVLKCRTSNAEIRQRLTRLRAQFPQLQDFGQLYVDRVVLEAAIPGGLTSIHIDDLELGPIVPPDLPREWDRAGDVAEALVVPGVEFRLDRLLVDGRPFFPRIVPYRGEPPELLRDLGFNVVWIPDLSDQRLIRRLWQNGLWITSTPPQPQNAQGDPLASREAGLLPFTAEVDPVLLWMLGSRIPGQRQQEVAHWIEQLEFADRRRSRPIAADVAFDERRYSRDVDLLAISRHPLQTSMSLNDYRLWLLDRRSLTRPGTFCWTWLQTETAPAVLAAAQGAQQPPVLEPEQVRLHAYAALAAGCRGLGYWTWTSLAGASPADEERRMAIRRLNLELKFLEPWLATSGSVQQIPCTGADAPEANPGRNLPFGLNLPNVLERDAQLRTRTADGRQRNRRDQELSAYVLQTELGRLVLPLWLEGSSQFVPAHGAVSNVSFVVPGPQQTAAVVELTTTHLRSLRSERITGGLRVELPVLDEVGFVWLTSDLSLVDRVRDRIAAVQSQSAETLVKLATLKLDRVGLIDQELQTLGPQQPDAPQKLGRAKLRLERARSAFDTGDAQTAAGLAAEVFQLMRLLQRDHWDAAVEHLSSPVSSPYTLCFQTLPDHWRLVSAFGASRERGTKSLLVSGEFEDFDTLIAENWDNVHRVPESLQTSAALFPTGHKSRYALRLECQPTPGSEPVLVLDEPAVTVTTPPIPVSAGQILHISGWVKVTGQLGGSRDGLMVYDSILGRTGSLRIHDGDNWTRFDMLRLVPRSSDITLSMSLTGLGQVLIDDLQVIPHDPRPPSLVDVPEDSGVKQTSGTGFFDRLPKLPRFSPLPQR